ncbi:MULTISPECIES: DNA gyrase subunit A [Bacteroidales]|uniref:DNA gyrase subunit A n=1 Tax=Bacteroidales TaxID=171549 RepID=UPI000FFF38E3|nr:MULTISPECIES: DNA gyrase subunit A [Bacteroidales]MBJ2193560.1 DNA gyrase subunit A [Muribaculaceae bacterium]MBJ2198200.1 DNA gyrase subunit A [Muribaculaceae bacterium]MCI9028930.1 DNA gyrase subunit A [Muribaculaceae bacterium]RXE66523.1 DNA gyrase subunit A [Muribaculaceae bacterium Isolate-001 (NCI)]
MQGDDKIIPINIESEMKSAYIDYSMSVIVSRALPDVRDGFKPVHRRVLFGMNELGNYFSGDTKKSARIVGEVMGKYHPHGDSSIYLTMVRLAQEWSLRYPLVFGQGNFGSIDGDSPAAMRYTEVKLARMGEEMLQDLDKDTVDFVPNFDNTLSEPAVLPTRIPNLLVNGASGIAVGMATNMPPHNLTEALNASLALIDNPDLDVEGLMEHIKAPDFPTGGEILGLQGVRDAFETGRGRIVLRAKTEIESDGNHDAIIISEIPYGVVKGDLVKSIAELVDEKKIDGIADISDTSARGKINIVIDIKKDANARVVLNKLFKLTQLQTSFSVNNVALVNGRPKTLNLKEILEAFVNHRHDVVIRRTRFELKKAEERAHILKGLMIAVDNIDEVIQIIRSSSTAEDARQKLADRFELDEIQTRAIVEMRLRQLTGLEMDKLRNEYEEVMKLIQHLNDILNNDHVCRQVMKDELIEIRDKYGDERRTTINMISGDFNAEDFYPDDQMIITISHLGYIKRTPLSEFRAQHRGGVGAKGSDKRDADFIEYIYPATNHNHMLFFTAKGRCYWLKVYEIPEGAKNSKGRAIQNLLNIDQDDRVNAFIRVKNLNDPEYNSTHNLIFATKKGVIKKTSLAAYSRPRTDGVKAIIIREDDDVIQVRLTNGNAEIILADREGRAIRFHESKVREMGRVSTGVRGMTLGSENDEIIGMITMTGQEEESVMVVSENGYGKRSALEDYRITNRGGKGVKTMSITEKTGLLVAIKNVNDNNDLMIINQSGITLRLPVDSIRVMGRATQGVKLIDLGKRGDTIASVCKVDSDPQEDIEEEIESENGNENIENIEHPESDNVSDNIVDAEI